MKNKLVKKFLSFSYGSWIGLVVGLASTMITTRILSPEDFGKSSMFTLAINLFLIIIVLGNDQSLVRFFYEENKNKRGGLLYSTLKIPIIITMMMVIVIILFNNKIVMFLFGESSSIELTLLLIIGIILQLIYRYAKLVIRMQQLGHIYSLLEIFNKSLNLLIMLLLFFLLGASYKILIYSIVITLIFLCIISILYGKALWNPKNIFLKEKTHTQKEIISYGTPFVFSLSIMWLFQSFDKVAIRQWSDFEELGIYSAAFRIVSLIAVIQTTFTAFWTPVSYEKFEKNPNDKQFFSDINIVVSFLMLLIGIFIIMSKDIFIMLLGSDYIEAAVIVPFLIFIPLLYTISETTVVGINFYKKVKWHILIAGVSCLANIVGNILLVPSMGALGASISTALSYFVFFILRTYISNRYFKINYSLKKFIFMLSIVFFYATISLFEIGNWSNSIIGIGCILILILFYKERLVQIVKKRIRV